MIPSKLVPSENLQAVPASYIALFGHSGSHAPQFMHSSVILIAMSSSISIAKFNFAAANITHIHL